MSILIKGIEMPQCCQDCPLNYDQMECAVTGTAWWSDSMVLVGFDSEKERLYDCPLIEVPTPHGRLADLDKMISDFWDCDSMIIGNYELEKIKAVIEAED